MTKTKHLASALFLVALVFTYLVAAEDMKPLVFGVILTSYAAGLIDGFRCGSRSTNAGH